MALKGFWDRLRGRETPAEAPPPAEPQPAVLPPVAAEPAAAPPEPELAAPPAPMPEAPPEVVPAPEPQPLPEPEPEPEPEQKGGWFARLKAGLSRSTARLTDAITTVFRKRRLDEEALEELEETLIAADLGVPAARRIVDGFRKTRCGKEVTDEEVKAALADAIA